MRNPFTQRWRGMRIIDLVSIGLVLALALATYGFKTRAGEEGKGTRDLETQIADEEKRIRLLKADITHLEEPVRLSELASAPPLGMKPIDTKHEVGVNDLPRLAQGVAAAPAAGAEADKTAGDD